MAFYPSLCHLSFLQDVKNTLDFFPDFLVIFSSGDSSPTPWMFVCFPWTSASFSVLQFLAVWPSSSWGISLPCLLGLSCIVMAPRHESFSRLSLDLMLHVELRTVSTLWWLQSCREHCSNPWVREGLSHTMSVCKQIAESRDGGQVANLSAPCRFTD